MIISEHPYPGLRPFTREESDIFFGREKQTDQLLEKLGQTRFISVTGLSGCGKSSLVRAGAIPDLESGYLVNAGPYWRIATMRPSNSPMAHLAEALLDDAALGGHPFGQHLQGADTLPFILAALRRGSLGLVDILRETPLPKSTNLLIVVDQFEELFRHHRENGRDESEAFVNLLLASASQTDVPIYVITTMRSEYIGDCALFQGLPEMMNSGNFLVPRLPREQQEEAIIAPAEVCGGSVDSHLTNTLLNEMGNDPDQLPLLQHCLMRMWAIKSSESSNNSEICLSFDEYEAVGRMEKALSDHADEAFEELDAEGQRVAEVIFRCLSERDPNQRDTRRPVLLSEVAAVAEVPESKIVEVADTFQKSARCFITPANASLSSDTMLDISHESLIRQWHRMKAWVAQEANSAETYRKLEQRAQVWKQSQRDPKWLWDSPDLDMALTWKSKEHPTAAWSRRYSTSALPSTEEFPLAMEFLEASKQAWDEKRLQEERIQAEKQLQEERERQKELKLKYARRQLVAVVLGLLLAIVLAGWAVVERNKAQDAETAAKNAQAETENALTEAEQAKAKTEAALARVEQAQAETKRALADVKKKHNEAEQARKEAEEQTRLVTEAQKDLQKAQKDAESNSEIAQAMVDVLLGFLSLSGQAEEFIKWAAQSDSTKERVDSALWLMVDLSKNINDDRKNELYAQLPNMSGNGKIKLLRELDNRAIDPLQVGAFLRQSATEKRSKDEEGFLIPYAYQVSPNQKITISIVDMQIPSHRNVTLIADAVFGKAVPNSEGKEEILYTAPEELQNGDLVTVRIRDNETDEIIIQDLINITNRH